MRITRNGLPAQQLLSAIFYSFHHYRRRQHHHHHHNLLPLPLPLFLLLLLLARYITIAEVLEGLIWSPNGICSSQQNEAF